MKVQNTSNTDLIPRLFWIQFSRFVNSVRTSYNVVGKDFFFIMTIIIIIIS